MAVTPAPQQTPFNLNLTQAQKDNLAAGFQRGQAQLAKTGTFNGLTPQQNVSNVMATDYKDLAARQATERAANNTPAPIQQSAPMSSNTVPMPQGSSVDTPKFDPYAIAASRFATQRAALQGAVNAYDASRKQTYDYNNQNNQRSRTLRDAMFHEQNNPFSGKYAYDKTNMADSDNIADTQAQMQYNNDISAENSKLSDFDANSAGGIQDLANQLQQQQFQNNISEAGLTGQYNGSPTMAAQGQQFNQGIAQAGLTGQYNGSPTMAAQNQQFNQGVTAAGLTGQYNGQTTLDAQKQMATLTGYMSDGKGGYIPTNTKQQQDLTNAWNEADKLGYVGSTLSQMTGIPVGTQTQTAKNQAQQIAVSNRNATNSENSTSNSNNNAKINQLIDAWKATGKAPAGLESLGVKQGDAYNGGTSTPPKMTPDSYKTDPAFAQDVAHMKAVPTDARKLDSNPQPFIDAYGYDGYLALRKAAGLDQ